MPQRITKIAIAMVLASAVTARAADPVLPAVWPVADRMRVKVDALPISDDAKQLVRDLTATEFAARERATAELTSKGAQAFPGIEQLVAASDDAELRTRTANIVGAIAVPPNTPARTVTMLKEYEEGRKTALAWRHHDDEDSSLGYLLLKSGNQGNPQHDEADLFFQIVMPQEKDPFIRSLLESLHARYAAQEARMALVSGEFDRAEGMLRERSPQFYQLCEYAALVALRRGAALDPMREVPALNLGEKSGEARAALALLLYRAKGDVKHALEVADGAVNANREPALTLLVEGERYDALIKLGEAMAEERRQNKQSNYFPSWSPTLALAYRLSGNAVRADEVLESDAKSRTEYDTPTEFIINDRMETAVETSRLFRENTLLNFQLLCQQLRIREALALALNNNVEGVAIIFARRFNDMGLGGAAQRVLENMRAGAVAPGKETGHLNFAYAAELERSGKAKEAAEWRRAVMEFVEPRRKQFQELERQMEELKAQYQKLAGQPLDPDAIERRQVQDPQLNELGRRFLDVRKDYGQVAIGIVGIDIAADPALRSAEARVEAAFWFDNALAREKLSDNERYGKALRIVNGKITDAEARTLLDDIEPADAKEWLVSRAAIDGFHRMGHDELAEEAAKRLIAKENDPSYWSWLGDVALKREKWSVAADYFRRAAVMHVTDVTLMYRMSVALAHLPEKQMEAKELRAFLPYLVLGESEVAGELAECMRQFEGKEAGDRWFDDYVSRNTCLDAEYHQTLARRREAAVASGDLALALKIQQALMLTSSFAPPWDTDQYTNLMTEMLIHHRLRALKALHDKDAGTMSDALYRTLDFGPPDVELLEKMIPALKAADAAGAAKVLAKAIARLKPVVEDYPGAEKYVVLLKRVEALQ